MIPNYDEYERFVRSILKRVPLLKIEQLIIALKNTYTDVSDGLAIKILHSIQKNGYVLLSGDGWAMTKSYYRTITGDNFFDGIIRNNNYRIDKAEPLLVNQSMDMVNCMWLVVHMMPDSENFVIGNYPWNILFTSIPREDKNGLLYEITVLKSENIGLQIEVLKNKCEIHDEEWRDSIRRIAIVDDEKIASKIPYIGFSHICVIDEKSKEHFNVLNPKRAQADWWKDYPAK